MAEQKIEIKGTNFTLFVLHLTEPDLEQVKSALMEKVGQAPSFFNCAPLVINLEHLTQDIDFIQLKEVVESQEFVLVGVTGVNDEAVKIAARVAGLSVLTSGQQTQASKPVQSKEKEVMEKLVPATQVHHGQIRSGQQIYAKDKNLVVIGSVSAGAEVIADGSIHIYGNLRGRAIAGAQGDHTAQIYCQNLQAELVSISGNYKLSETLLEERWEQPARVCFQDEKIHISGFE